MNKIGALRGTEGVPSGEDEDGNKISEDLPHKTALVCSKCGNIIKGATCYTATDKYNQYPLCGHCFRPWEDYQPKVKSKPNIPKHSLDAYFRR